MGILKTLGNVLRWLTPGGKKEIPKQLGTSPAVPRVTGVVQATDPGEPRERRQMPAQKDKPSTVAQKQTSGSPVRNPPEQKTLPAAEKPKVLAPEEPRKVLPPPAKQATSSEKPIVSPPAIKPVPTSQLSQPRQPQVIMDSNTERQPRPVTKGYSTEFLYLDNLIRFRIAQAFQSTESLRAKPEMPPMNQWSFHLRKFITRQEWKDDPSAKTLILVALAPYIYPDLFDTAIFESLETLKKDRIDRIGGVKGKNCPFFLPTGETAIFLIGGNDHSIRQHIQDLFGAEHEFWEKKILWLEDLQGEEPPMHGKLIMSTDYVDLITSGNHKSPQFSISFPARKIPYTNRTLDDLIVSDHLKTQIAQIKSWLLHKDELQAKFGELIKKGYRTLFYGPPGTGKTFTAMILAKDVDREVFKIDLSMIVSKYIGETEKNLEQLFSRAKDKNWILFFDEADALFGKRTNVRDAHDKYANQEVSYLLQRIEDYDGLVILATNMKNNIDDAFCRRFNSVLHFPFPEADQRYILWIKSFFPKARITGTQLKIDSKDKEDFVFGDRPGSDAIIKIDEIAETVKKYELSGGSISNVVQYAIIKGMERYHLLREQRNEYATRQGALVSDFEFGEDECNPEPAFTIYLSEIIDGIKNELIKEGKPFR